jgi:hypothetical protein
VDGDAAAEPRVYVGHGDLLAVGGGQDVRHCGMDGEYFFVRVEAAVWGMCV